MAHCITKSHGELTGVLLMACCILFCIIITIRIYMMQKCNNTRFYFAGFSFIVGLLGITMMLVVNVHNYHCVERCTWNCDNTNTTLFWCNMNDEKSCSLYDGEPKDCNCGMTEWGQTMFIISIVSITWAAIIGFCSFLGCRFTDEEHGRFRRRGLVKSRLASAYFSNNDSKDLLMPINESTNS